MLGWEVLMRTQHYPNCENATSRTCRCRWCSGTRHGWEGALRLATSEDPADLKVARDRAEVDWSREQKKHLEKKEKQANPRTTFAHKAAAVGICLVEVISLLRSWSFRSRTASSGESGVDSSIRTPPDGGARIAPESSESDAFSSAVQPGNDDTIEGPSERPDAEQVEHIGRILRLSLKEVERNCPHLMSPDVRQAMADHFWCEMLAQLAFEMDKGISAVETIPDRVADIVVQHRKDDARRVVPDAVVRAAVAAVWRRIQRFSAFGVLAKGKVLVLAVRILAIFVCKQPERHQAVVQHCIDPLGKDLLEKTKERLLSVLHEWLPGIQKSLV